MSVHSRTRRWLRGLVAAGVLAVSMAAISAGSAKPRAGLAVMHDPTARVATGALAAGPSAGTVLGGLTSQGWPVVVEISKNGKRIDQVAVGLNISCTSGIKYGFDDGWTRLLFGAHGKIHASVVIPPSSASSGESFAGGSDSFTGTLNRQKSTFSGVWHLVLTYKGSTGQADRCDSGRVTFSVRL